MATPTHDDNDETIDISLKHYQDKLGFLYRFAERQALCENRIYALWDTTVDLLGVLSCAVQQNGILFSYPQAILGGDTPHLKQTTPDFGLYWREGGGDRDTVSPVLFCEIKSLDDPDWHTMDRLPAQKVFDKCIDQFVVQAFCGFHEFPDAENIRIIVLAGIFFTLLDFPRPEDLPPLPDPSSLILSTSSFTYLSQQQRADAGKYTIAELMPDAPTCLVFLDGLFDNPNKAGAGLVFSQAFCFAIRHCLGDINIRSCYFMDFSDADDYELKAEHEADYLSSMEEWYDRFHTQAPRTPVGSSTLESPTSSGTDFQVTRDPDYSPESPLAVAVTRKRKHSE